MSKGVGRFLLEIVAVLATVVIFWVPLYFVVVNAMKNPQEAALFNMEWPSNVQLWDNLVAVVQARDYMLLTAYYNSSLMTVLSIMILISIAAMAGFVLQRRKDKATPIISFFVFAGLIIPPAVV